MPVAERRVPIIADERVDPEFGTGAVKITPGHDPMDWEIGRDHVAPRADGDRARRPDERGSRRVRGHDAGRGRGADRGATRGARPDREARAVSTCRRPLRPFGRPHRAARPAPVVGGDEGAGGPGDCGPARGAGALEARAADEGDALLPREHPALVHLAAALVGPPDSGLVLRRGAHNDCRDGAVGVREVRDGRSPPGRRRARHVVLVGALAVRDTRLARADARPRDVLSRRRLLDRARHQLPLGLADDLGGDRADG